MRKPLDACNAFPLEYESECVIENPEMLFLNKEPSPTFLEALKNSDGIVYRKRLTFPWEPYDGKPFQHISIGYVKNPSAKPAPTDVITPRRRGPGLHSTGAGLRSKATASSPPEVKAANALYQRKYRATREIRRREAAGVPVSAELRMRSLDGNTKV